MLIVWRLILSVTAAIALGLSVISRRSRIAAIFSVVLVVALGALATIVTFNQVQEHRAGQAVLTTSQQRLTPTGLPADQPAQWQPGATLDKHPTGAAAPSPVGNR